MSIIYRVRDDIRYAEVPCANCRAHNAVSENALEFYAMSAPFLAYLCPACRRQRYPDAVLYGELRHQQEQAVPT